MIASVWLVDAGQSSHNLDRCPSALALLVEVSVILADVHTTCNKKSLQLVVAVVRILLADANTTCQRPALARVPEHVTLVTNTKLLP